MADKLSDEQKQALTSLSCCGVGSAAQVNSTDEIIASLKTLGLTQPRRWHDPSVKLWQPTRRGDALTRQWLVVKGNADFAARVASVTGPETSIAEIVGPSGRVHYRRPPDDPMCEETRNTPGYSVRIVKEEESITEPTLSDVQVLRELDEGSGCATGDLLRRVAEHVDVGGMTSQKLRRLLLDMQARNLIKPLDDLKPVAWSRTAAGTALVENEGKPAARRKAPSGPIA